MDTLRAAMARGGEGPLRRVIYTESHDEVANGKARLPAAIWPGNGSSWFSRKRSMLGAVLVFTAPGIPMILQGQEFLEDQWFHDQNPIDWANSKVTAASSRSIATSFGCAATGTTRRAGFVEVTWRSTMSTTTTTSLAYHRWNHGGPRDDVVVILNLANRSYDAYWVGLPRKGRGE